MKTYEVTYDRKKHKGVFGISLVENPAMEEHFIALAKNEQVIKLKTINEEKRELIGVVLEPNKPIYRNQNGEEFNIVFPDYVVKELLIGFSQNGYQTSSTIEHKVDMKLEGVTVFENWIVEDEKNDKSNIYDLEAKKGSWVANMKVDNEDIWNEYVKTGIVKGYSIDAMVDLKEIKLNSNMSKVELNDESKNWFKSVISELFSQKQPVQLAEAKPAEPVELEEEKEDEKEDEKVNMMDDAMKAEIMDMIQSVVAEAMKAMQSDVEVEMSKVKKENEALKVELKKIGEQPASKPIKSAPSQLDFSKMTPYEKFREQNKKFR